MRIACIGGGPAGLYFAISMKLRDPAHDIDLFERNRPTTRSAGASSSPIRRSRTCRRTIPFRRSHPRRIRALGRYRGPLPRRDVRSAGHGFIGIGRKRLLESCRSGRRVGCGAPFRAGGDPSRPTWRDYDLVIAADGANCRFRDALGAVRSRRRGPHEQILLARHREGLRGLHLRVRGDRVGWVWAHAYRFARISRPSSSNVRTRPGRSFGLDRMSQDEASPRASGFSPISGRPCVDVQRVHLLGSPAWLNFRRINCADGLSQLDPARRRRPYCPLSIGSGTKLALEDAIKLAEVLNRPGLGLKLRSTNIRPSGTSRCSSSRTARATRPNGSRPSSATPFRAAPVRLFPAHPLPALSHEICACATGTGSRVSSAGSGRRVGPPVDRDGAADVRALPPARTGAWPIGSSSRQWRPIRPRTARRATSTSSIMAPARPGRRRPESTPK